MEPVRTPGGIWGDCKGGLTADSDSVRRHLLEDLQQLMSHRGRAGRRLRNPPLDDFTEMSPPKRAGSPQVTEILSSRGYVISGLPVELSFPLIS